MSTQVPIDAVPTTRETSHDANPPIDVLDCDAIVAQQGLTEGEARKRHERGLRNGIAFAPSRSYRQILLDNAFMSINVIIFVIGTVLITMG